MKMGYEGKGLGMHKAYLSQLLLRKGLSIWVLVIENMMEKTLNPRRHMKVFQEGLSFHVHYLELVKIVFMMNATVLHPLWKNFLISMQLMRLVNKKI